MCCFRGNFKFVFCMFGFHTKGLFELLKLSVQWLKVCFLKVSQITNFIIRRVTVGRESSKNITINYVNLIKNFSTFKK